MRVLVACEFSGIVRDAFLTRGHDAWSCDLLDSESGNGRHIQGDALRAIHQPWTFGDRFAGWEMRGPQQLTPWDLLIAFPPCTHLCSSGARWFKDKTGAQESALAFVQSLLDAPIPRIALENPIGVISTAIRKPDQIIQPWQFGHGETKATCLWLKNLPKLTPTNIVEGRVARVHREPPSPDRWKKRSITYAGIAAAMAEQWGKE